jgi:hypothetical protein
MRRAPFSARTWPVGARTLCTVVDLAFRAQVQRNRWFDSTGETPAEILGIFTGPGERMTARTIPPPTWHSLDARKQTAQACRGRYPLAYSR